jgi:ABC-2 family transporter protein
MDLSVTLYALRWFTRDTFSQARSSRMSWLMLGLSAIFIAVCLSVGVQGGVSLEKDGERLDFLPSQDPYVEQARDNKSGVVVLGGEQTLFFGAIRVPLGRDAKDAVHFVQLLLAGGVADTFGILLALIWTAGFLPTFLEPNAVAVLVSKPAPRWTLLMGKYLGVLAFVAVHALIFVGGTWAALGLRTGIWDVGYLLCVPLLLLHFSIFFSVSALLATCTRSPIVCILGSLLFWFACWGMNYGRHVTVLMAAAGHDGSTLAALVNAGYWVLPKPADLGMVLFDALKAGSSFQRLAALQAVDKQGAFQPVLSVLTSLAFTLVTLAGAARRFATTDY